MPVNVGAMRVIGPVKCKTDHYDVFPSCKKPPSLSHALRRHIIGNSCPELRSSYIAPDLKEDVNFHVIIPINEEKTEKDDGNGGRRTLESPGQQIHGNDSDVVMPQLKFCRSLRIPGREVTVMGFQLNRKSCEEVVMIVNGLLESLVTEGMLDERDEVRLSKYLERIKMTICSPKVTDKRFFRGVEGSASARNCQTMLLKLVEHGCIGKLVENVGLVGFEEQKMITFIFCNAMRRQWVIEDQLVKYLEDNANLLMKMLEGYKTQRLAFANGMMLRECFKFESLAKAMLNSKDFYNFFSLLHLPVFEISSDAFLSFIRLLTEHRSMSANFLKENYDEFFSHYTRLLNSENYVTRLSSIRFLSKMLLDKPFYSVMGVYVQEITNLKQVMVLMSCQSQTIQYAAYQTFKIFAANPDTSPRLAKTLVRNRKRILSILDRLAPLNDTDQFLDETEFIKRQLNVELPKIISQAEQDSSDVTSTSSSGSGSKSGDDKNGSI